MQLWSIIQAGRLTGSKFGLLNRAVDTVATISFPQWPSPGSAAELQLRPTSVSVYTIPWASHPQFTFNVYNKDTLKG